MRNCSTRAFATVIFALSAVLALAGTTSKKIITYHVVERKLPAHVVYQFSRRAYRGRLKLVHEGKPGFIKKVFEAVSVRGKVISRKMVREEIIKPTDTVYLMAESQMGLTSRHQFDRGRVLHMVATGYAAPPGRFHRTWGRTCTGMKAKFGLVAVDPRVIPLGTLLYVEGYGFAKAEDTGGAIKGHRIDLCFDTYSEADRYGMKKITVYELKGR